MPTALKMPSTTISSLLLFLLFFFFFFPSSSFADPAVDAASLLKLKSSFVLPSPDVLSDWSPTSKVPPCSNTAAAWSSVLCVRGNIAGLLLGDLNLSGTVNVDSLLSLPALRSISLTDNHLSGPIPAFNRLTSLKGIFISNNNFSGDIADNYLADMHSLKKLWIDGNGFTGMIPSSLAEATNLREIHLENNKFSGTVPDIKLPSLEEFNVANNSLTGPIPEGLGKKFPAEFFSDNPGLCGPPLSTPCATKAPPQGDATKKGSSGKTVVLVIIFGLVITGVLAATLLASRKREGSSDFNSIRGVEADAEAMEAAAAVESSQEAVRAAGAAGGSSHRRGGSSRGGGSVKGNGGPNLVMVNEERGVFGLPDLMKAAAEVLGNGGLGSAYKAIMSNGVAVAVKRMRELNRVGKDVFDGEMRKYGRLRHRNVLPPLAYLYRREEKLIVSEYVSKGNLLYILHGDRGPDHAALDWLTRLKIIRGVVRGMAYLHVELASLDVPHGNLKSCNVLLTTDYEPLIVDYGFIGLVNPAQASNALFAYKSPEAIQHQHVSPKSDVYCLGILILEILTGKFPSQYLNNAKGGTDVVQWTATAIADKREAEVLDPNITSGKKSVDDMVKVLRMGAMCTEERLEERPTMRAVMEMVDDIARSCGANNTAESTYVDVGSAQVGLQRQSSNLQRTESQQNG